MQGTVWNSLLNRSIATIKIHILTLIFFNLNTPGVGQLLAAIVSVIVIVIVKASSHGNLADVDYAWRVILGVGAIPALAALYYRLTIPETPRWETYAAGQIDRGFHNAKMWADVNPHWNFDDQPIQPIRTRHLDSWIDFMKYIRQPENAKLLFAMSFCWFAIDFGKFNFLTFWLSIVH